jgi:hypothetical protein
MITQANGIDGRPEAVNRREEYGYEGKPIPPSLRAV